MTIDGIKYVVLSETPYDFEGKTRYSIRLRRPRGKRVYVVIRYENGTLSSVV